MTPGVFHLRNGDVVITADAMTYIDGETHVIARLPAGEGDVRYVPPGGEIGDVRSTSVIIVHPTHKPMRLTVEYIDE